MTDAEKTALKLKDAAEQRYKEMEVKMEEVQKVEVKALKGQVRTLEQKVYFSIIFFIKICFYYPLMQIHL